MIRFTDPGYLLLIIPATAGLAFSFRRTLGMAKARKKLAFAVRALLCTAVIVAIAGPQLARPNKGTSTVFLVDRSASISEEDLARQDQFLQDAFAAIGPDDTAGVVVFGQSPLVDSLAGGRRPFSRILTKVPGQASDLAAAVRLGSAMTTQGKGRRLVLLTDGNETAGDVRGAVTAARSDDVTVDVVPLGKGERQAEVAITNLELPSEAKGDQPFTLRATLESQKAGSGTLRIERNNVVIRSVPVAYSAGETRIVVMEKIPDPGFARYRATLITDQDTDPRNNVGAGFVRVTGKSRVLVLQDNPAVSPLTQALRKNGISVDLGGPGSAPVRPEDLQGYEAVFLNDINSANITEAQQKLLQSGARDSGIGLAMIGGESSFLPGGYYGTPIAEALPVDLNIRQRKSFPGASILIIIDCSGSMSETENGVMKLRLAAKAAEETVKLLSPQDRIGVAGSTDGIEFVAPMQTAADKAKVIGEIRKIAITGGGIYIGPSMSTAEPVIRKEPSKIKHIILMADGSDSTDWRDALQRTFRMRQDKITTSVVAVGDGKDVKDLKRLALLGGGQFYMARKASELPALVTQDTSIISRSAIEEGAFLPKLVGYDPILRGVSSTPPLMAYCLTDGRPLANVLLRTGKDDPLLATWQYGLATTMAFTSDAQARWAARWVTWEGFSTFWSQAARGIGRRNSDTRFDIQAQDRGGRTQLTVTGVDRLGQPIESASLNLRVSKPDGSAESVRLDASAPGKFEGEVGSESVGTYIVTVPQEGGVSASGFSIAYPAEYRAFRLNKTLLDQVIEVGGGRFLEDPAAAFRPIASPGESIQDFWPAFALLSALLLPFDIAIRRLALPLAEVWSKALAWIRSRRREPAAAPVVVDQLRKAKVRAQTARAPDAPTVEPPPPAPAPIPRETVTPRSAPHSTSASLLESRRKRRSDDVSE